MKYNEEKRGFTLIELLAVIIVLSLIFAVALRMVNISKKDVDDKIDKTTKKMILSAADEYTLEFRDSDNWKEEKTSDGTTIFCISFDSLVEKGYFKNNGSNYNEISNGFYAIKGTIKNNVYNYEFIELTDNISDDDICKYYRRESNFYTNSYFEENDPIDKLEISSDVKDGENNLGSFDYKIQSLKNNSYAIKLDLNINLFDVLESKEVYANVVLDKSGSMKYNKFARAKEAALNFSKILSETEGINAHMSLIEFGLQPMLKRGFSTEPFDSKDFSSDANGNGTNASGGLDLVTSLIVDEVIKKNSDVYTILLFDGEPCQYSTINYTGDGRKDSVIYPKSIQEKLETKNYNIFGDAEIYYKNFHKAIEGCQDKKTCPEYITTSQEGTKEKIKISSLNVYNKNVLWQNLSISGDYLKNVGSKLIVIGYGTDFGNNAKKIATEDSELCNDSKYSSYCYYYNATGDNISALFSNLANNIIKYSEANKIILSLVPNNQDGKQLINIYDSEGNLLPKIEKIINVEELETEDGNLQITDNYKFTLSNYLYESMNCSEEKCTLKDSIELFNIELKLIYPNSSSKSIDIEQPLFNIGLYKESTLN